MNMTCPAGHSRAFMQYGLAIFSCLDCSSIGNYKFCLRDGKPYWTEPEEVPIGLRAQAIKGTICERGLDGLPSTFGQMTGNLKVPPIVEALGPLTERDLLGFAAEPAAPIAPAAVFDSIEQLKEIMRRLNIDFEDGVFSAPAEPQPIESDSLPELIERITNLRDAKPSAEGDARIAELEAVHGECLPHAVQMEMHDRMQAAEAKLRAVSDALEGGEALEKWDAERFAETWGVYTRSEVDVIFARIRAIVEGSRG